MARPGIWTILLQGDRWVSWILFNGGICKQSNIPDGTQETITNFGEIFMLNIILGIFIMAHGLVHAIL